MHVSRKPTHFEALAERVMRGELEKSFAEISDAMHRHLD
jgi:hypothetical protein